MKLFKQWKIRADSDPEWKKLGKDASSRIERGDKFESEINDNRWKVIMFVVAIVAIFAPIIYSHYFFGDSTTNQVTTLAKTSQLPQTLRELLQTKYKIAVSAESPAILHDGTWYFVDRITSTYLDCFPCKNLTELGATLYSFKPDTGELHTILHLEELVTLRGPTGRFGQISLLITGVNIVDGNIYLSVGYATAVHWHYEGFKLIMNEGKVVKIIKDLPSLTDDNENVYEN